ncbi:hypothetical protein BV25DRAFT_1274415 [Artomyces pyxidatus]|uniref:Uncharacterized protein n=1 Tax=Artomyces pyxidatus TaxID=48021 RepID=A0ACB8TF53_9AGAM|nr:hypothetical protein BV25DRAFT_1274415 [Artomyces pyxidatus]
MDALCRVDAEEAVTASRPSPQSASPCEPRGAGPVRNSHISAGGQRSESSNEHCDRAGGIWLERKVMYTGYIIHEGRVRVTSKASACLTVLQPHPETPSHKSSSRTVGEVVGHLSPVPPSRRLSPHSFRSFISAHIAHTLFTNELFVPAAPSHANILIRTSLQTRHRAYNSASVCVRLPVYLLPSSSLRTSVPLRGHLTTLGLWKDVDCLPRR